MGKELLNTFDKELLLKDLSARLPYSVKAQYYGIDKEDTMYDTIDSIYVIGNGTVEVGIGQYGWIQIPFEVRCDYAIRGC